MPDAAKMLPGVPMIESPLFTKLVSEADLKPDEFTVARQMSERGYAVIEFPDAEVNARIDRIKAWLGQRFDIDFNSPDAVMHAGDVRLQDAWRDNEDVRAIASNPAILALLGRLYGRPAFPFQTLNFPVGTQQHPHSDAVHFSCLPERFMCGVWLAFEDVRADAGPLTYYPGSHKWPITTNGMIGRRGWQSDAASAQHPFEEVWRAMIEANQAQPETFLARKGQALLWTANLLHGGAVREDRRLTRWSQVTHYYFDDCIYYTPAFSDEFINKLQLREPTDISTGSPVKSRYLGAPLAVANVEPATRYRTGVRRALKGLRRVMGSQ